jgi:hypothetical protein
MALVSDSQKRSSMQDLALALQETQEKDIVENRKKGSAISDDEKDYS